MTAGAIAYTDGLEHDRSTIPDYLLANYWWAYVHPNAVRVFERQWLINLILWGNFARLRDAALAEFGPSLGGRTLQVACVYGDFSPRLAARLAPGASLDIVDILPIQLANLRGKLAPSVSVSLHQRNSAALGFADDSYDQAIIFFLLHEQPAPVRKRTLAEAIRVVKPGGRIVLVDYHGPGPLQPLRYVFRPVLGALEPYALDLWEHDIAEWFPEGRQPAEIRKQTYFGGLYQKLVITVGAGSPPHRPTSRKREPTCIDIRSSRSPS